MRVLSPWYSGVDPVFLGRYLVERWQGDFGALFYWSNSGWREAPSMTVVRELDGARWKGLAFDPYAATHGTVIGEITDGKCITGDLWLVEVPR